MQVYQDARVNDSQFASARDSLAAGEEKTTQGRAGLLPSLGVSGNYARTQIMDYDTIANDSYTISLSQPLFNWGNYQLYEQGKLATASSEAQFAQAQQDLIVRVAQAYFDVLAAQDALAFVRAQKVAISEQLESAKRNFEVGTATITDTHEAQARYDLAVAQEFAGISDLEIKRAALQQIIGKYPSELAPLKPAISISSPEPGRMDAWVNAAENQNYGVIGSRLALETAKRAISLNRAGHYPTVNLVASRTHSNQAASAVPITVATPSNNSVGVQWNIPLFSGFAVTSRVREAIALEDKARNDLETARRNAAQLARQSFIGVTSGLAQVKALEAAEVSSQSALESNKLGYEVGVRINIDVLNAQQQVYSTLRDLARARYDTIMNGLKLKSAAGTLKEEDLLKVSLLLQ
jgi:outer membrane protein